MESITVAGKDITAKMTVLSEARQDKNGNDYHIGRFAGKGFNASPDFYEAWSNGKIQEITLSPTEYTVSDPLNADQVIKREGWSVDGFMTIAQYQGYLTGQKATRKLEVEVDLIEKQALKELKLDTDTVNKLMQEA